jgi:hypothetical protein
VVLVTGLSWAVTFATRYAMEDHPVDVRLTDRAYVVFDGTEEEARARTFAALDAWWAFMYLHTGADGGPALDFARQIHEYGLMEVRLPPRLDPEEGWVCSHCGFGKFQLGEHGWFYSTITFAVDGTIEDQWTRDETVDEHVLTCMGCMRAIPMPEEGEQ